MSSPMDDREKEITQAEIKSRLLDSRGSLRQRAEANRDGAIFKLGFAARASTPENRAFYIAEARAYQLEAAANDWLAENLAALLDVDTPSRAVPDEEPTLEESPHARNAQEQCSFRYRAIRGDNVTTGAVYFCLLRDGHIGDHETALRTFPPPEGHRYATNEAYFIDGPADAALAEARARGLVA